MQPQQAAEEYARRRVLVTGASGFIGTHLVERLRSLGAAVRTLGLGERGAAGVEHVRTDYRDATALDRAIDGVEVVFHLAGVTKASSLQAFRDGNVRPTAAVLDALARRAGNAAAARLVLVSSLAAAGPSTPLGRPRTEEDADAPIEGYGASKLEAERLVAARAAVPWTIVSPGAVYGAGDRDFPALFRQARWGVALHASPPHARISIVHVADVIDALLLAGSLPAAIGRRYFVASEVRSWREIHVAAAAAQGRALRVELELPRALLRAAGVVGDLVGRVTRRVPLVNNQKVRLVADEWVCATARARGELGFAPRVTLEQGLRELFAT